MPTHSAREVGHRVATARRLARLTQQDLADAAAVSYSTVRAIERGGRRPSDHVLESLAAALGVDPSRLLGEQNPYGSTVRDALPAISSAIAAYDIPQDGPVRPLHELHTAAAEAESWRLASQYLRIAQALPELLSELSRALHSVRTDQERDAVAGLLTSAFRSADGVAYKSGARDLSARLIDLMRWSAGRSGDPTLECVSAYVRGETFFAAHAHAVGLQAMQKAIDSAQGSDSAGSRAGRGTLHMRAAVLAARSGDAEAADEHTSQARRLGDSVPEGVYSGTAFGPSSVRIHEVSVAVGLGDGHLQRALDVAREWAPPRHLPAERRSAFYIELARAQLWSGLRDDAFESLKVARRIAPQHAKEHPWVQEDIATLRRLKRADREDLSNFAGWCHAI